MSNLSHLVEKSQVDDIERVKSPLNEKLTQLGFHGSYRPEDVTFLMQIDDIAPTDVKEKEYLIQSGKMHYSQMISVENPPSTAQMQHFQYAFEQGSQRLAEEVQKIANQLLKRFKNKPLVLISLVRAGVPLGVLLKHCIEKEQPCYHYGISIIRDRGIDFGALQAIISQHGAENIVFVDGWTGKGAIYGELQRSLAQITDKRQQAQLFHQGDGVIPLVTLADPAGVAWLSASDDDWLMPASLLNSTVSGLISRTLYRELSDGLHQAVYYDKLQPWDRSGEFIQTIDALRKQTPSLTPLTGKLLPTFATQSVIDDLAARFAISNRNRIKPTIAEATRAILRRDPEYVLVNEMADGQDTALLRHLCKEKNIQLIEDASIAPYQAVTIIKNRSQ